MNFRRTPELEMKKMKVPQSWAVTDSNWGEYEPVQYPQEITVFKGMQRRKKRLRSLRGSCLFKQKHSYVVIFQNIFREVQYRSFFLLFM